MNIGSLLWSDAKGEGRVRFSKAFDEADTVVKLDALVDCMWELNQRYKLELKAALGETAKKGRKR